MSDSPQTAIRVGDEITHSDALFGGVTGMILGGLAGLVIGAVILGGTIATGGALAFFIGCGLLGVAGGGGLGKILGRHSTPNPKGKVLTGSPNVFVGGKPAARADADVAHCEDHSDSDNARDQPSVRGQKIMQGSGTVFINGFYASRKGDKGHCDFALGEGFPTVFIGGPTQTVKVKDPKTGKDMEIESETSSIDGLIWGAGILGGALVMLPAGMAIVAEGTAARLGLGAIAKQLIVRLGGQVALTLGLSTAGGAGLKYVGGKEYEVGGVKFGGQGSETQDLLEFGGQTLTPFVGAVKIPGLGESAYGLIDGIPARFPRLFGGGKTPSVVPEHVGSGDGDTAGTGDKPAADAAPTGEPEPAQALPANTPHLPEPVPAPEAAPEVAAPKTGETPSVSEPLPKLNPELPEPEPAPETEDPEVARVMQAYDALGDTPPKVEMSENDSAYADAHTLERHGPDIPLERGSAPTGDRTIEGRIYGDEPWRTPGPPPPDKPENFSYKWKDASTMNRTVNDYLQNNWEQVRSDLAVSGRHQATFNTESAVGEGYSNSSAGTSNPPNAVYGQTSMVTTVIKAVPGDPSAIKIITAYPNGRGFSSPDGKDFVDLNGKVP